ncbi:MAG: lipoyl(octanoyl) transferase LipB [Pseudobdellovibrio sp.]
MSNCFNKLESFKVHENDQCIFYWLGSVRYDESLQLQNDLLEFKKRHRSHHSILQRNEKNFFIGLEHDLVLTLGLRAHDQSEFYSQFGFPIYKIRRGGLATVHNSGQLVIYPIVDLKSSNLSVKKFVENLFLTTQELLEKYKISCVVDVNYQPGVYTKSGKIAFCGLQISNGITQHGLSLNNSNNLDVFEKIESCGIKNANLDSIKENGIEISNKDLFIQWSSLYKMTIVER